MYVFQSENETTSLFLKTKNLKFYLFSENPARQEDLTVRARGVNYFPRIRGSPHLCSRVNR